MVDAVDSKSTVERRAGSSPASGTTKNAFDYMVESVFAYLPCYYDVFCVHLISPFGALLIVHAPGPQGPSVGSIGAFILRHPIININKIKYIVGFMRNFLLYDICEYNIYYVDDPVRQNLFY